MAEPGTGEHEIPVAVVGRPRGKSGEVILHPYFDLKREHFEGIEVALRWPGRGERRVAIRRIWWHQQKTICHFEGCNSIDDARELTHAEMVVLRKQLAALDDDEFLAVDLIGCQIVLADETPIGTVTAADEKGSPLLTIAGAGGRELLVPFAGAIVVEVDIQRRRIVIDPPQGLFEINED